MVEEAQGATITVLDDNNLLTGRCSLLLLVMLSVNKKKCSGVPTAYLPSLSIDKLTMVSSQCLSSSSILPFGNLNCFNLCQ